MAISSPWWLLIVLVILLFLHPPNTGVHCSNWVLTFDNNLFLHVFRKSIHTTPAPASDKPQWLSMKSPCLHKMLLPKYLLPHHFLNKVSCWPPKHHFPETLPLWFWTFLYYNWFIIKSKMASIHCQHSKGFKLVASVLKFVNWKFL